MSDTTPSVRRDLEFFPIQHEGQQLVLIKDHLGLVQEGKAVAVPLYQLMTLLDGTRSTRDLQMALMQQQGGILVGSDEIVTLLSHLDESYLLDSERFRRAKDQVIEAFLAEKKRPPSHCGKSYPGDPEALEKELERMLANAPPTVQPEGNIKGLIAPHIDLAVGSKVYAVVYNLLRYTSPSKVIILGVGHQLVSHLFCITDKTFESPLGNIETEKDWINELRKTGGDAVAESDFTHRSEHSIEFQLLFLRHMLREKAFTIVPILCGFPRGCLEEYSRAAYVDRAGPFLEALSRMIREDEVILVAGVDLSHIGPKFGHEMPASHIKSESQRHDQNLLEALVKRDAERFWQESHRVKDQYNVCGFSALACLIEVLPPSHGKILDYQIWDEDLTQSAVSFASAVFTI